jgi:DNA-binding transcriptional LysR family regulator
MEFRAIRRLLMVVELGSVSDAAKKLNISQPALTRSIQQLEYAYNAKLIERTAQGIKLTRVGQMLEPTFHEILKTRDRIHAEISRFQSAKRWHTSFGVCVSFENIITPAVLAHLHARSSAMDVHIHSGLTTELVEKVVGGELEFALGLQIEAGKAQDPELRFEKLATDRLIVIARPDHPLVKRSTVSAQEFIDASWILPRSMGSVTEGVAGLLGSGETAAQRTVTLNSHGVAREILQDSDFITISSELSVRKEINAGRLGVIHAPNFKSDATVGIYSRNDAELSELGAQALSVVRESMKAALETA